MLKVSKTGCLDSTAKLLIASSAVYFFSFITADPDLWGHIKFGEDLWLNGKLVRFDPYSFTAYGQPWINHEWLTELIFYCIYFYLGDSGLLFGKLAIGIGVVAILYGTCRSGKK